METNRVGRSALMGAVIAALVGGYLWGHAPVGHLTAVGERQASLADEWRKKAADDAGRVDAARIVLLGILAKVDADSLLTAQGGAHEAYVLGALDLCHQVYGPTSDYCSQLQDTLNPAPRYPSDQGYLPRAVGEAIGRDGLRPLFEQLKKALCMDAPLWPAAPPETGSLIQETCAGYGSMVGQELLGD